MLQAAEYVASPDIMAEEKECCPILDRIEAVGDVKSLLPKELCLLAGEIRELIIRVTAENGGHLASNLGVVELTIVLHRLLDWERDFLVWDVGHQAYTHKILTGRKEKFTYLRKYHGLSGFPEPEESATDPLRTGHSSTSIATALGLACSRPGSKVVAVVGDASLGGGVAFEGLNKAAALNADICVVLNANEMAISPTIGGLALSLTRLITNPYLDHFRQHTSNILKKMPLGPESINLFGKMEEGIKNMLGPAALFQSLGLSYFGPFDGHNLEQLEQALTKVMKMKGPRLVHVVTRKGKGYPPAEADPEFFHSAPPFTVATGRKKTREQPLTYRDVFGEALVARAGQDSRLVAVTAAMAGGTGLEPFKREYPERFYDVGIAEQASVAFAGGLARGGKHPVVAIYATFFQRAFDQLFQEVCLQNFPVTMVLPNNGLVEDGPTHHGLFSYSYLRAMPNLTLFAPFSFQELRLLLNEALDKEGPAVILFPKDRGLEELKPLSVSNPRLSVLAVGSLAGDACRAAARLKSDGYSIACYPISRVKPLDAQTVSLAAEAELVVTVEENVLCGGFGAAVLEFLSGRGKAPRVELFGVPDSFPAFGRRARLLKEAGLDEDALYRRIKGLLETLPGRRKP